ncbi:MAG: hypothetical protein JNM81_13005, partial [Rhodospirillaceae bacterium]|nr:hypothetical protein [Rhodospirillaceae bacterium]
IAFTPHLRDYLDHVPPDLQPSVAIIDVYSPDRIALRMAGTQIVDAIGHEPTVKDTPSVYNQELQKSAVLIAWAAVTQPCGYAAKREIRSRAGRVALVHGIALPIRTERPDCKTLVNFSSLARSVAEMKFQDRVASLNPMTPMQWIDIGNGVPETVQF